MYPLYIFSIFFIFFVLELLYFEIADKYQIIDKPNERSSHSSITIRGGGIIFLFATLIFFFLNDYQYPYFMIGLFLISLISFVDDVFSLDNKVRLIFHIVAVALVLVEWRLNGIAWYILPIASLIIIGVINAYNFMDGINGITGSSSLITIITLYYLNQSIGFANAELLIFLILAALVFLTFNFRKQAKCFAGDVGSISIAFSIIFLIGLLAIRTNNWTYILLLLIYGLDTSSTIIFRLIRRESIFQAHRTHFYQYLANEKKISHLVVSAIYSALQVVVNVLLIQHPIMPICHLIIIVLSSWVCFVGIRFVFEGRNRLLTNKSEVKIN